MEDLPNKILVVEDDARLNQMMADMLATEGYQVSSCLDGLSAIQSINAQHPDVILLDMMLPGCDGLTVLSKISDQFTGIIIMITAKVDEFLEVSALNLGVHDYLIKPVRPHILVAKIKALSRLSSHNNDDTNNDSFNGDVLNIQNLAINTNTRELFLNDVLITITPAEYDILLYFMRNPMMILSRDMLIKAVRNLDYDGLDRSIDMRISSLRKKLNDTKPPYKYIKTVRAKGYILPA